MVKYCCVKNCMNSSENRNIRFFILPRGNRYPATLQKWVVFSENESCYIALQSGVKRCLYFCSAHFRDEDFTDDSKLKLIGNAVPSIRPIGTLYDNIKLHRESSAMVPCEYIEVPEELHSFNCHYYL